MKTLKKRLCTISAYLGIGCVMLGGCLADSQNLIPTVVFVALGVFFVFVHKRLEVDE